MNEEQLKKENIHNLTQLWRQMGSSALSAKNQEKLQISNSWPHRLWLLKDQFINDITIINDYKNQIKKPVIIPVYQDLNDFISSFEEDLTRNGLTVSFEQTAMYLDLKSTCFPEKSEIQSVQIQSDTEIQTWTDISADAFEYEIDSLVISKISTVSDIKLILAYKNNQACATALLFKTGDIVGIHQMGVLSEFRGQGIARALMQDLIQTSIAMSAKYITLQASSSGKPLYESLGFKPQFKIKNVHWT